MKTLRNTTIAALIAATATLACNRISHTDSTPALPTVHAHRGGAALMPENTIEAMQNALSIGVPVLELDLHVTADSQVVVSHDPWLNPIKILSPDGMPLDTAASSQIAIFSLPYDSLRLYDAGSLHNPAYPRRRDVKCHIPLASALIDSAEVTAQRLGRPAPGYNIEIKSWPTKDGILSPDYKTFADLCMSVLLSKNLGDRLIVQCFDVRTLQYLHEKYPDTRLSYLVEKDGRDYQSQMTDLGFTPYAYSPESCLLTDSVLASVHQAGMIAVPWTVDDKDEVARLTRMGADVIITNAPDSVMAWVREVATEKK